MKVVKTFVVDGCDYYIVEVELEESGSRRPMIVYDICKVLMRTPAN